MSAVERNYDIYDKELLAIIKSFEEYRSELISYDSTNPVIVLYNYKNLEYFTITKRLNS